MDRRSSRVELHHTSHTEVPLKLKKHSTISKRYLHRGMFAQIPFRRFTSRLFPAIGRKASLLAPAKNNNTARDGCTLAMFPAIYPVVNPEIDSDMQLSPESDSDMQLPPESDSDMQVAKLSKASITLEDCNSPFEIENDIQLCLEVDSDMQMCPEVDSNMQLCREVDRDMHLAKLSEAPQTADCDFSSNPGFESLPMDILVKIMCHLHHYELLPVFHVSQRLREAVCLAKEIHFDYTTPCHAKPEMPNRMTLARSDANAVLARDEQCPNAPTHGVQCPNAPPPGCRIAPVRLNFDHVQG